jgi:hypothetical protein
MGDQALASVLGSGKTSFLPCGCPVHYPAVARKNAGMKDSTELRRTRQSIGQNKLTLMIFALIAAIGFIGWVTSL